MTYWRSMPARLLTTGVTTDTGREMIVSWKAMEDPFLSVYGSVPAKKKRRRRRMPSGILL
jgi:hypothetical protein